jgi:undecaprenyl-diphosphatase
MILQSGLFQFLQSMTGNPVLDQLMIFSAEFLVLLVPVTLVYLWFRGEDGRKDSLYVFTAVVIGIIASYAVLGQLHQHDSPYQNFDTIASGESENSFPSQHATAVLSMVLPLLWRKRERLAGLLLGTGVLTGFARIYIGEHYLVDILGAGAAAVIGFGVVYLIERFLDDQVEELADFGHMIERTILGPVEDRLL